MPGAILATELMDQKSRGFQAVLVSLDNRQIRMYKEKFLVGILDTGEHNVVAMAFGQFGREESALITINGNGALTGMACWMNFIFNISAIAGKLLKPQDFHFSKIFVVILKNSDI